MNLWRARREKRQRQAEKLLHLLYMVVLERSPEPDGIDHHMANLLKGLEGTTTVLEEMLSSAERQEHEDQRSQPQDSQIEKLLELLYIAVFDRRPDPEGTDHLKPKLFDGIEGITAALEEMLSSAERQELEDQRSQLVPRSQPQDSQIEKLLELLYTAVFDRRPDPEGTDHLKPKLFDGIEGITAALEEMLGSAERKRLELERRREHRSVQRIVQLHKSHLFRTKAVHAGESLLPISMRVSQIYISDSSEGLPKLLHIASDSVRNCFKEHHYCCYSKDSARSFISQHYGERVTWAYDRLAPYAYKADLARYCIINKLGGWYVDISLLLSMSVWPVPVELDMIYFADRGERGSSKNFLRVQPGLFYSKPGNPILDTAIELIVRNCETEYYGSCALSPTGPELLGRSVACHGIQDNHIVGEFAALTPECEQENKVYILPTGEILALYKTTWAPGAEAGQLASIGASGTNDYGKLWEERAVYRKLNDQHDASS